MRILVAALVAMWATVVHAEVKPAPIPSKRLIVFVHGIFGDAEKTFRNTVTSEYWPELLRKDRNVFERADIYSYNYMTSLGSGSPEISDLASEMARTLDNKIRIRDYQSVLFIAHSLGGIIVRKYLLDEFRKSEHGVLADNRVRGILLFGTPMNGSDIANFASLISRSPTLRQLWGTNNDAESYLARLTKDWVNSSAGDNAGIGDIVKSRCAYETVGVLDWWIFRRDVVSWSSAAGLCNKGIEGVVGADHLSMVKPPNRDAPAHQIVRVWYQEIFKDKPLKPGDVVLASCEVDPYARTFTPKIADELTKASISHYGSVRLPKNWRKEDISYLWLKEQPKVIVMHYGCFANSLTDDASPEAGKDFNLFLKDIEHTGIKVVMYTRAYYPDFLTEMLTKENIAAYYKSGRIYPLALRHGNPDRSAEAKRLREVVKDALNGKAPRYH